MTLQSMANIEFLQALADPLDIRMVGIACDSMESVECSLHCFSAHFQIYLCLEQAQRLEELDKVKKLEAVDETDTARTVG